MECTIGIFACFIFSNPIVPLGRSVVLLHRMHSNLSLLDKRHLCDDVSDFSAINAVKSECCAHVT